MMFDWIMGIFEDCFRWLLWLFVRFFLLITDWVYAAFKGVTETDVISNKYILSLYMLLGGLLIGFILYRIIKMTIKVYVQPEYRVKSNPMKTFMNIFLVSIVFGATPYIYSYTTAFTSEFVEKLPEFMGIDSEDIKISDFIVEGGSLQLTDTDTYVDENGDVNVKITDYNKIDINEKNDDDQYIYFDDTLSLILVIIVAVALCYLLTLISISYAVRAFSIAVKYICGVYFISALIEDDDNSFKAWTKALGADMATNIIQVLGLYLVVVIVSAGSFVSAEYAGITRYIIRALFMAAGFMFVLSGPNNIAQLIGGDGAGTQSVIQAMYQAMTLKSIGSIVKSTIGTAGAAGIYAAGRAAGAPSIAKMAQQGMAGAGSAIGAGSSLFGGSSSSGGSGRNYSSNFNAKPTKKQEWAAQQMGINIKGMSRGEASQALEAAGMDRSYWQGTPDSYASSAGTEAAGGASYSGDSMDTAQSRRPMTKRVARIMAAKSDQNTAYRALYRGSRAVYEASARRVSNSKLSRPITNMNNASRTMYMMFGSNDQNGGGMNNG